MKCKNTNIHITQSSFVDWGKSIKIEDIKEEMNEEESVDDPLSILGQTNSDLSEISENLAVHKRIHTGTKPYEHPFVCYICGDKFSMLTELTNHKEIHVNVKSYSCDGCQTSYTTQSVLLLHNKTAAHLKRMESLNMDSSNSFNELIDRGEVIKVEDIKEEMNEVESVDDPLNIQQEKTSGGSENIATEIKEEWIDDNSPCVQDMNNSEDEENSKVVNDIIDIVEHKIENDVY
jgi:uncharacterized Zn-finger protein